MTFTKKIGLGISLVLLLAFAWKTIAPQAVFAADPFNLSFSNGNKEIDGSYNGSKFVMPIVTTAAGDPRFYSLITTGTPICDGSEIAVPAIIANGSSGGQGQPINFKYKPAGSSNCQSYTSSLSIASSASKPAPSPKITWSGATGTLNADGSVIDVIFSDGSKTVFTDSNTSDKILNFKPSNVGAMGGATVASWCDNTKLTGTGGDSTHGITLGSYTDKTGSVNICYNNGGGQVSQGGITIPIDTSAYTPPGGGGTGGSSCESNFNDGFNWVMCPALDLADSTAGAFNGFIEGQLCVNTGSVSSTGNPTCDGTNILGDPTHNGIKNAWSIFKNLASALLVIIMLVMVIAQAIGGGPIDAYTIRKVLPKLVIAVIAMQLSWYFLRFAIDVSNDAGRGIADLMYYPFGGASNLGLDKLVGANLGTHTTGTNDTFAFFAVIAGGVGLLALSLPGLLLMALYVVIALLTAFIVLIFRKLLLIMLIITAPLALVAWILPGTDNYWKLWKDNFTKILMMFPMIMALIAAGRIFAYITAGSPSGSIFIPHLAVAHLGPISIPYFASATSFIDLAIILVAYFGPYFFLPKTYKWGGAAMGAIGKGVQAGVEKGAKPAKDYLDWRKGLSPWKQARAARRAEQERRIHHGFYEGLSSEGAFGRVRRARLGGVGMRGAERGLRGRIVQQAESELEKSRREEIQRATLQLTQHDLAQYDPGSHDDIRRAIIDGSTANVTLADGTTPAQFDGAEYARTHDNGLRAALDRGVVHGHWKNIEAHLGREMASGDRQRIAAAQDFLQSNAQTIGTVMPHLLKGIGVASESTPSDIAQMRGEEVESILGRLSTGAAAGDTQAAERLSTFLRNYQVAASTPQLKIQLSQVGARAVKAHITNNAAVLNNVINNDPADGRTLVHGLDPVHGVSAVTPVMAVAGVDMPATTAAITSLTGLIADNGIVS